MDDIRRVRTAFQQKPSEKEQAFEAVFQNPAQDVAKGKRFSAFLWKVIFSLCVLGIVGVGGSYLYNNSRNRGGEVRGFSIQSEDKLDTAYKPERIYTNNDSGSEGAFDPQKFYSAVLSDGLVYFGRVTQGNAEHYIMEEVFYEQQGGGVSGTTTPSQVANAGKLVLVKLGTEEHQPEDVIYLQKNKVLSISPLKDDSVIMRAIRGYLGDEK